MQSFYPSRTRISAIIPKSMMEFSQKSQNKPKKKVAKLLEDKVANVSQNQIICNASLKRNLEIIELDQ